MQIPSSSLLLPPTQSPSSPLPTSYLNKNRFYHPPCGQTAEPRTSYLSFGCFGNSTHTNKVPFPAKCVFFHQRVAPLPRLSCLGWGGLKGRKDRVGVWGCGFRTCSQDNWLQGSLQSRPVQGCHRKPVEAEQWTQTSYVQEQHIPLCCLASVAPASCHAPLTPGSGRPSL